jgi:hypothetical protein
MRVQPQHTPVKNFRDFKSNVEPWYYVYFRDEEDMSLPSRVYSIRNATNKHPKEEESGKIHVNVYHPTYNTCNRQRVCHTPLTPETTNQCMLKILKYLLSKFISSAIHHLILRLYSKLSQHIQHSLILVIICDLMFSE